MSGLAAALAVSAPMMLANEQGMFHFPTTEDAWRLQRIQRTDNEREWPFAAGAGYLMCVWILGERVVYFAEPPQDADAKEFNRVVVVSTNPLDLMMVNLGKNDVFAPFEGVEQLVLRLGPFVDLGRRLCSQPRGSEIGPGEL
ncbi:hypothetical protein [Mesorhizobium sp. CAU 1741]|uniref:hypothetical protein n=1 Tax=Mesorhizobium sp. CAU 1741 TaxID=3140366 RepID=UPI00325A6B14